MILKIDHISYSCDRLSKQNSLVLENYQKIFGEESLENIDCKKKLLKLGSNTHNIYMYQSKCGAPIEITQYPVVSGNNTSIEVNGYSVLWRVSDVRRSVDMFCDLGFEIQKQDKKSAILYIIPFLDKKRYEIIFVQDKKRCGSGYLDVNGFSSLGIFVDSVKKTIGSVRDENIYVSGISRLCINKRMMDIAFIRGASGEIVEVIGLAGKESI